MISSTVHQTRARRKLSLLRPCINNNNNKGRQPLHGSSSSSNNKGQQPLNSNSNNNDNRNNNPTLNFRTDRLLDLMSKLKSYDLRSWLKR
mmetsp:Transcript_51671/g.112301  ORF Transcript_51671/g.112301 Transcript_51671/m.112301 type:complete len:90 (+) Transcript_51671:3-272(+)